MSKIKKKRLVVVIVTMIIIVISTSVVINKKCNNFNVFKLEIINQQGDVLNIKEIPYEFAVIILSSNGCNACRQAIIELSEFKVVSNKIIVWKNDKYKEISNEELPELNDYMNMVAKDSKNIGNIFPNFIIKWGESIYMTSELERARTYIEQKINN